MRNSKTIIFEELCLITSYSTFWKTQYIRLVSNREQLWSHLDMYNLSNQQFIQRPKTHLWSIDEILRHMLASEVMYIHQKFDHSVPVPSFGVGAQWVGKYKLKTNEASHYSLIDIKNLACEITDKSVQFFNSAEDQIFQALVKAPWGEEMTFNELLEHFSYHEAYHCGQVHYLMNLIGDPLQVERIPFSRSG